jgi:stage V sporulation protein G
MNVTEVRVHMLRERGKDNEKLRAFATITFDNCFVVREVKVIEGERGLFVAMPSRKQMDRCRKCGCRNATQSNFCNGCGIELPKRNFNDNRSREKIYLDIAHPVNSECRQMVHRAVIDAYNDALAASPEDEFAGSNDDQEHSEGSQDIGLTDYYESDDDETNIEEEDSAVSAVSADAAAGEDGFDKGIFS